MGSCFEWRVLEYKDLVIWPAIFFHCANMRHKPWDPCLVDRSDDKNWQKRTLLIENVKNLDYQLFSHSLTIILLCYLFVSHSRVSSTFSFHWKSRCEDFLKIYLRIVFSRKEFFEKTFEENLSYRVQREFDIARKRKTRFFKYSN